MTFLNSILNNSKKYESPFNHWEYNNAISDDAIKEIENWNYQKLDETNRVAKIIKEKIQS